MSNGDDPKAILHYIFQEIVKYKCTNLSWTGSGQGGVLREEEADSNRANH